MSEQPLSLDDALERLARTLQPVGGSERLAIADARGRISVADVVAPLDLPPFPCSAMDGYAIATSDGAFRRGPPFTVAVSGESRAGHPMTEPLPTDAAARVFTGAMMPRRSDAVVLQEDVVTVGAAIRFRSLPPAGTYVRGIGHDIAAGARLSSAGTRLGAFELAHLTASGLVTVRVRRRLRVAIFSTGDELVDPPDALDAGRIYDANRMALAQLLKSLPVDVVDLGILPDEPERIRATLEHAAAEADAVLTSGGVSVGDADHVRGVVAALGEIGFWRLALKPGKPLAYGRVGNTPFFGLPGNPVSTIVTYLLIVRPALMRLAGGAAATPRRIPARARARLAHTPGRAEYQRGIVERVGDELHVAATGDQSSNRLSTFAGANCLVEIAADRASVEHGEAVDIIPFDSLLV